VATLANRELSRSVVSHRSGRRAGRRGPLDEAGKLSAQITVKLKSHVRIMVSAGTIRLGPTPANATKPRGS